MIGIIVTTWNGLESTKAAIASIRTKRPHRIIVSDNASTDGTQQWAKQQGHELVESDRNLGCGHARNMATRLAIEDGCDTILWCQNDVLLHKDCIDNLAAFLDSHDHLLVAAVDIPFAKHRDERLVESRLRYYQKLVDQSDDGARPDTARLMEIVDNLEPADILGPLCNTVVAALTPETIETVGWIDDGFTFADWEDRDYVRRVEKSGNKATTTQLALYHHTGANSWLENKVDRERSKAAEWFRNEDRYRAKWGGEFLDEKYAQPAEQPSLWPTAVFVKWGQGA